MYVPTVAAVHQINKTLADYKPNLITLVSVERAFLFGSWQFPGRGYAKEHQVPYITEYHTDYYNFAGSYPIWRLLREVFIRPVTKYLYHQFDSTIVPSKLVNNNLQQMGVKNSLFIPIYGFDSSLYNPSHRNRNFLDSWLSEKEKNNKVLLFLGRLCLEKQIELLIEVFARLRATQEKLSLIIAGDGPTISSLKSLARPILNIHFTGFIHGKAKAQLLASCDLFCSPSPYETFGRTIVEAMASGLPVIAIKSGAISEYMIDGVNGYLVPSDTVEELTHCIERALSNDNSEIIQNALQDADQLSSQQGCQKLNDYYEQLLNPVN